jgi:trypsin
MYKFILSFIVLISFQSTFAVYVANEEDYNYAKESTAQHQYACHIKIDGDKPSAGTGTLIASNVILTIAHVIENNGVFNDPNDITVTFFQDDRKITRSVKSLHRYNNGKKDIDGQYIDNAALLVLTEPVLDTQYPSLKISKPGDQVERVTMMGFGNGGLLNTENFPDVDIVLNSEHIFRWTTILLNTKTSKDFFYKRTTYRCITTIGESWFRR